jgi:tRNA A-37 threonylcarbamoyl transferase component Bud32
MLIPLVARLQCPPCTDANRFAAWKGAIERLHDDWMRCSTVELGNLGQYLSDLPVDQQPEAIVDLVAKHLRLSWCVGEKRLLEDYLSVLRTVGVALSGMMGMPADLVEDEFLARHTIPHGDMPHMEHYARRFPARCDILQLLRRREVASGRFVKLAQLGQGASAEVWVAFDREQQTEVALKFPRADRAQGQQWLERSIREAQLTSALNHPGIVKLCVCVCDPAPPEAVLVMRLAKGKSLSDEIRNYHQPPSSRTSRVQQLLLERLLNCLASVCDALDHAHACGIVHCDIKPGNIVFDQADSGLVLDWGLAQRLPSGNRELSSETSRAIAQSGELPSPADALESVARLVAGTPDYTAPEQLTGECDTRTDVFGLGATLYEILAGRAPHAWTDGLRPKHWMSRVRVARVALPRRWNPTVPMMLEARSLRAVSRDPKLRQPNAADLASEIRHYVRLKQVTGATSLFSRAWRRLRRASVWS